MKANHVWVVERSYRTRGYATTDGSYKPFDYCNSLMNSNQRKKLLQYYTRKFRADQFRLRKYTSESSA